MISYLGIQKYASVTVYKPGRILFIMRKTLKDGEIRITLEGNASAFRELERPKKKTAKSKSRTHRRVRVVTK